MQNEITKTEWKFKTDMQDGAVNLYTAPYITAKLQYTLNKYFQPALEKQIMLNLSDDKFRNIMKASGIKDIDNLNLSDYKGLFLNEMKNKPLEELTKYDFDKAVDFCILCLDKQKILQEEDGKTNLKNILNKENWEIQDMELMEGILNQYSFRTNDNNVIPDGSMGEV